MKNKLYFFNKQSGASLVWVMVIVTIVLIVITSLASGTISEIQSASGSNQSVLAFNAARAGSEAAKGEGCRAAQYTITGTVGSATYSAVISAKGAAGCDIESSGTVGTVTRKIKTKIEENTPLTSIISIPEDVAMNWEFKTVSPDPVDFAMLNSAVIGFGSLQGGFIQQFDLYRSTDDAKSTPIGTAFLDPSLGEVTEWLGVSIKSKTEFEVSYNNPAYTNEDDLFTKLDYPTSDTGGLHNFRVKITYRPNSALIQIKISDKNSGECLGAASVPFRNNYAFNRIYTGGYPLVANALGDIDYVCGPSPHLGCPFWVYDTSTDYNSRKSSNGLAINVRTSPADSTANFFLKNMAFKFAY